MKEKTNNHNMRWYEVKFKTYDRYNPTERTVRIKSTDSAHASVCAYQQFGRRIEVLSAKVAENQG